MRLKVLLTAAMLIALPAMAQQRQAPPDVSPSSLPRVRAALEKPPSILVPPPRKADFSVHIESKLPLQEIFDSPPWATPPVQSGWGPAGAGSRTSSLPLISFDVLPLLDAVKRAYAQHAARAEVRRAIVDYCAARPDAGAGIQICSASASVR